MRQSTKDTIRQAIGWLAGGLCLWHTKDGVGRLYEDHQSACSVLDMTSSHCARGLDATWQWTTLMSSIGAITVGVIVWHALKFGPLGRT